MIQSIKLQNYQSHANSKLEFSKGVNIIVGASDSGKSGILRALRWVIENRPGGDSVCSNWGGETVVELETENHQISKHKGKENKYTLTGKEKKEIEFKAFGTNVPVEIQKALNITEANTQYQFDSHFLLSDTSGAVASHFNKVANLEVLDTTLQNIQRVIFKLGQSSEFKSGQLKNHKEELTKFDYLEQFEIDLAKIEEHEEARIKVSSEITKLSTGVSSIVDVRNKIEKKKEELDAEAQVNMILSFIKIKNETIGTVHELTELLLDFDVVREKINKAKCIIGAESDVDDVLKIIRDNAILNLQRNTLNTDLNTLINTNTQLKQKRAEIARKQAEFESMFPDICPLCNTPIKHEH